jgi:hypothetical protein
VWALGKSRPVEVVEKTHSKNGTGNRSEIRGLSSTPKACIGERERASSIIHAVGVRFAFPSSAPKARGSWLRWTRQLPDRHDLLEFVAEILEVIRGDAQAAHFLDHGNEVS